MKIIHRSDLEKLLLELQLKYQQAYTNALSKGESYAEMMYFGKISAIKDLDAILSTVTKYHFVESGETA